MSTRRALSLSDKLDILEKYDLFPKTGQREAASKLNISQSVSGRILKNRENIECGALQNESHGRKRKRCGKDDNVECASEEWAFVKKLKNWQKKREKLTSRRQNGDGSTGGKKRSQTFLTEQFTENKVT